MNSDSGYPLRTQYRLRNHPKRNNPLSGAIYFLRGIPLALRPGIRRYILLPLLINIGVFSTAVYFGADWLDRTVDQALPEWEWLEFVRWILIPAFVAGVLVAGFFVFNLVANLIAAPFNGLLANAIEERILERGEKSNAKTGSARGIFTGIGAAIASELRKFSYIALRCIPLLLLFLIPGLNLLAPLLWLLLGAWMMAIAYMDYPMANHDLEFPEQRRLLKGKWLLSMGFGWAVMLALAVPLVNFLVIPCAVAGATLMWVEQFEDEA
ncbi:sulfate transporter CysZ [Thioalkalivibrio sp. HK1]|uniref:sulfate transporter CysZ n=1 Tax=Thioalkalivibrio sp. HK1 TaxID=1469245 RepID=UPI00046E5F67|nr:sulfate transporter CysZ [Thioalkalivibrio sp. HK1]